MQTADTISGKLVNFFVEKLQFRKALDSNKVQLTYEDITKKLYLSDDEGIFSDEDEDGVAWESEEEVEMDEQ